MSLRQPALFAILRKMKASGDDFYHDGEWTAIRAIELTPQVEARLATAFGDLLTKYRGNTMQVGMSLVWEGYVSPEYDQHHSRFYLVVTLEGWCPKTAPEFDQAIPISN